MKANELAAGDVVKLKIDGGPEMVVERKSSGTDVIVVWFVDDALQRATLAPEVLEKVE